MKQFYAGIDAGSTCVKVVVMNDENIMEGFGCEPTGIDADGTANSLIENICLEKKIKRESISGIIATGYSRRNMRQAHDSVTEIQAHARGAAWSAGGEVKVRTVIDIGGQDSKVIIMDSAGVVSNFVMNDKCAAGTGRFLESLSRALQIEVGQLGPLSLESGMPLSINSTCVVFAESEVISLVARKKKREDIIAGIHASLAKRVGSMARKAGLVPEVLLTGGGGLNSGIARALEEELRMDIHVPGYPQFNGAIGAAIIAKEQLD